MTAADVCKHCGQPIASESGTHWLHATGLARCDPELSGGPYGLNADPIGAECQYPCIGSTTPHPTGREHPHPPVRR